MQRMKKADAPRCFPVTSDDKAHIFIPFRAIVVNIESVDSQFGLESLSCAVSTSSLTAVNSENMHPLEWIL